MDALVIVCLRNTNVVMILAWPPNPPKPQKQHHLALEPVASAVRGRRTYAAERTLNPKVRLMTFPASGIVVSPCVRGLFRGGQSNGKMKGI